MFVTAARHCLAAHCVCSVWERRGGKARGRGARREGRQLKQLPKKEARDSPAATVAATVAAAAAAAEHTAHAQLQVARCTMLPA